MVCCWFWPSSSPANPKNKRTKATINTLAHRRRPASYPFVDSTPLLTARTAASSSFYGGSAGNRDRPTPNGKRLCLADHSQRRSSSTGSRLSSTKNRCAFTTKPYLSQTSPSNHYSSAPRHTSPSSSTKAPSDAGSRRGTAGKSRQSLNGSILHVRGMQRNLPESHSCTLCALYHPGPTHRTAYQHQHQYQQSSSSTRVAVPAPNLHGRARTLRRTPPFHYLAHFSTTATTTAAAHNDPASIPAPPSSRFSPSSSSSSSSSSPFSHANRHDRPPRPHVRPNTTARRAPAFVFDARPALHQYAYRYEDGDASPTVGRFLSGRDVTNFAVRAATSRALEDVRMQAFREQQRSAAARRVSSGGRSARPFPPHGGLERWL